MTPIRAILCTSGLVVPREKLSLILYIPTENLRRNPFRASEDKSENALALDMCDIFLRSPFKIRAQMHKNFMDLRNCFFSTNTENKNNHQYSNAFERNTADVLAAYTQQQKAYQPQPKNNSKFFIQKRNHINTKSLEDQLAYIDGSQSKKRKPKNKLTKKR